MNAATTNPMFGPNKFKLGLFRMNCEGGLAITSAAGRWRADWDDILAVSKLADDAGLDLILPLARWKGYGGSIDNAAHSFEVLTQGAALAAATRGIAVFVTVHVPLVHPVFAAKSVATIDHISHGRVGLNMVCGCNKEEFDMFGADLIPHDDRDDEILRQRHHVVERGVGHLGLHHPELGQVAARLRFLGPERGTEAVHAAQRHGVRLVVKLSALGQERSGGVEVGDRKEGRRALARGRREDRRIDQHEPARVEECPDGVDHLVTDAQDRLLALGAQPQVAVVQQVFDAMLLRGDGVVLRFADQLQVRHVDLVAARRARVRAHLAPDGDGGLLSQVVRLPEDVFADGGLRHDRLNRAGAVADRQEVDAAAGAAVVQPAAQRHLAPHVRGYGADVRFHCSSSPACSTVVLALRRSLQCQPGFPPQTPGGC